MNCIVAGHRLAELAFQRYEAGEDVDEPWEDSEEDWPAGDSGTYDQLEELQDATQELCPQPPTTTTKKEKKLKPPKVTQS